MAKKHYTDKDFIMTDRTPSFARYGYCAKCGGDIQAFKSDNYRLRHYNSHKRAPWNLWHKKPV